MKEYFELAKNEPVRLKRRLDDTYILMTEDHYSQMQIEIESLERRLMAMSNILNGEVREVPTSEELLTRFK